MLLFVSLNDVFVVARTTLYLSFRPLQSSPATAFRSTPYLLQWSGTDTVVKPAGLDRIPNERCLPRRTSALPNGFLFFDVSRRLLLLRPETGKRGVLGRLPKTGDAATPARRSGT